MKINQIITSVFLMVVFTSCQRSKMYKYFYKKDSNYAEILKSAKIKTKGIYKSVDTKINYFQGEFAYLEIYACQFLRFKENGEVYFGNIRCDTPADEAFKIITKYDDKGFIDTANVGFKFSTYQHQTSNLVIWYGAALDNGIIVNSAEKLGLDSVYFEFIPLD